MARSIRASAKICRAPAASSARSSAPISNTSPDARSLGTWGCSDRLAATNCDPGASPAIATPNTSWHPRPHLMEIVHHEDERRWAAVERGGEARRRAAQRRTPETAHVFDQPAPGQWSVRMPTRAAPTGRRDRRRTCRAMPTRPDDPRPVPTPPTGSTSHIRRERSRRPRDSGSSARFGSRRLDSRPRPGRGDRDLGVEERPADLSRTTPTRTASQAPGILAERTRSHPVAPARKPKPPFMRSG